MYSKIDSRLPWFFDYIGEPNTEIYGCTDALACNYSSEATEDDVDRVTDRLRELGLKSQISQGEERTIIGVIGDERLLDNQPLTVFSGVESVTPIMAPWKLVSREFQKQNTIKKRKCGIILEQRT